MKFFLFAMFSVALLGSNPASASFMEQCHFDVEVVAVDRIGVLGEQVSAVGSGEDSYVHLMSIEVAKVTRDLGQSSCERHQGNKYQLVVKSSDSFKAGDKLKLIYTYANSFTPQGVASMVRWEVAP